MEDTWTNRDLPVLDATVRVMETNNFPAVRDIASAAGMDIETTGLALEALDGTYVDLSMTLGGPESWNVKAVSAEARRAVGQWPTAESLVTRLAEGFSTAADREPDPEKKSRLRTVAGILGGAGRDIAVEVAAAVVEQHAVGPHHAAPASLCHAAVEVAGWQAGHRAVAVHLAAAAGDEPQPLQQLHLEASPGSGRSPGHAGERLPRLRHYFASTLLHNGVDIRALATYLGHTDPGFTLRIYTHLMPDAADRMRSAVDLVMADGPATSQAAQR